MNRSDPIAALEIGTSRTMIAIAEPLGEGRIRIAAYDSIPSNGVRKSQIVDVAQARYSVSSVQKKLVTQSDYAVAQGCKVYPDIKTCWWWTRTPGCYNYYVTDVRGDGTFNYIGSDADRDYLCVRPAMWIDLTA